MSGFRETLGTRRKRLLSVAGFVIAAVSIAFGLTIATSSSAQPQNQSSVHNPAPPAYEFDVATIKPSQRADLSGGWGFYGEDTFRAINASLRQIIQFAYGLMGRADEMVSGGPKWLDSDRYNITAKMDASMADRLKHLTPDQRTLAQEQMVQALLADRFKFAIHRETKELPVYTLTIMKSGPKLHRAKPGDTYADATFPYAEKFVNSDSKAGRIFGVGGGGPGGHTNTYSCFGVSMPALARQLAIDVGLPVLDRTGLTGTYDFTLKYTMVPWSGPSAMGASEGQPAASASEPTGIPTLFPALQQQLGLKLESTKGPVEIVVIDHIERPSGN
jgi:uncharacterized protein (TIGR03435 family)